MIGRADNPAKREWLRSSLRTYQGDFGTLATSTGLTAVSLLPQRLAVRLKRSDDGVRFEYASAVPTHHCAFTIYRASSVWK